MAAELVARKITAVISADDSIGASVTNGTNVDCYELYTFYTVRGVDPFLTAGIH